MTDKDTGQQGKSLKNNPAMSARKLFQTEVDKQVSKLRELLKLKSGTGIERVDLAEIGASIRTIRGGARLARVSSAGELLDAVLQWCEYYCENWCQDASEAREEQQAAINEQLPVLSGILDCLSGIAREAASKEEISADLIRDASELGSRLATTGTESGKASDAGDAGDAGAGKSSGDASSMQKDGQPEAMDKASGPAAPVSAGPSPSSVQEEAAGDQSSESAPAPAPAKEVTPAVLKMRSFFWKELEERVEVLTQHLLELEQGLSSPQRLETMMRMAHTIKGGARLADIEPVMQLAHTLEDIFVNAQKQQITINSNHTDLLLKGVDSIVQLSEQATQQSGIDQAAMEQYQSINKELARVLTEPDSFKAADDGDEEKPTSGVVEDAGDFGDVAGAGEEEVVAERVIRVNAEKLNKVIGLAGELSVETRQLKRFWQENIKLRRTARAMHRVVEKCVDLLKSYQIDENDRHYLTELMRRSLAIEEAVNHNCDALEDYERKITWLTDKLVRETLGHRMRPFKEGIQGLRRLVRTLSRNLGKKAHLEIRGENTQVDRDILERLNVPLTHLIQNALDHGLESADVRLANGKPEEGHISIEASHKAGLLVVTVKDDGGGVNREKLRASIIKKNMATEDMVANMSDAELYEFLLLPNFSLKDNVTTLSGRGVGMDLIHEMVQELRGRIVIHSEEGKGCCFELLLPLTLSTLRCVVVEVSGFYYALPVGQLNKVLTFTPDDVHILEGRQYLCDTDDVQLGLVNAHQLLELPEKQSGVGRQEAIVLGRGSHQYAVIVDSVIGEITLVERPIDPRMGKIKNVSSAAFLDDGTPILILDADDLLISVEHLAAGGQVDKYGGTTDDEQASSAKRVLVVDDSMTVRELERSLLEGSGYRVDIAVDGVDGWNAVRMNEYDLVISDIDMPRMDGFEFISCIRGEQRLQNLPVIIISYKDRESDRKQGLEVGADHYLTKGSFMDETFIRTVHDLIGSAQPDEAGNSGDIMNS